MVGGYNISLHLKFISSSNREVGGIGDLEELYYITCIELSYIKWSFEKLHSHSLTLRTTDSM
jgi:hypothetical protein